MERIMTTIATDGSGNGTGYAVLSHGVNHGSVVAIRYVKTDYADGVDVVFSGETSGIPILTWTDMNATGMKYPRDVTHDIAGAASLYAATGEPVESLIPIANERIKIVVSSGGTTNTGTFHIWIG